MRRQLWPIDAAGYTPHPLHRDERRAWPEANCYVDLWIELLHTLGLEPLAALPFTFAIDFEGDQWTFFKFPIADLDALFGIEVIELNVWRPLLAHIEGQLAIGRPSIVEVDAFHLPDTLGTSYHAGHVKTSIAIQALDDVANRLGYFHNGGYYELEGADFFGLFRLDRHASDPFHLPPYVEVVKRSQAAPLLHDRRLVAASLETLTRHLDNRPIDNPFRRYAKRFPIDIAWLSEQSLEEFHRYAFATLRQCGAAFELGGAYLRWLESHGEHELDALAGACDLIATTAKTLQFKTARVVGTGRSFDPSPLLQTLAATWDRVMSDLMQRFGALAPQG